MNIFTSNWARIFDEFDLVKWGGLEGNVRLETGELVKTVEKIPQDLNINVKIPNGKMISTSWDRLRFESSSLAFICGGRKSNSIYLHIDSDQFASSFGISFPSSYKKCIDVSEETVRQLRLAIKEEMFDARTDGFSLFEKKCRLVHDAFIAYNDRKLDRCLHSARLLKFNEASEIFELLIRKMEPVARTLMSEALRFKKYALAADLIRSFPREILDSGVERYFVNEFAREIREDLDFGYESEAMRMAHLAGIERLPIELGEELYAISADRRTSAERSFLECISRTDFKGSLSSLSRLSEENVSELHGVKISRLEFVAKLLGDITTFQDIAFCQSIIAEITNEAFRNTFSTALKSIAQRQARRVVESVPANDVGTFVRQLVKESDKKEDVSLLSVYVNALESAIGEMPVTKGTIKLRSAARGCAKLNDYGVSDFPFLLIKELAESLEVYDFVKAGSISSALSDLFPAQTWIKASQKELVSKIAALIQGGRYIDARSLYLQARFCDPRQNGARRRLLEEFVSSRRSHAIARINHTYLPIVSRIIQFKLPVVNDSLPLAKRDLDLIVIWSGRSQLEKRHSGVEGVIEVLGDYEVSRLYAARAAELVALDIYRKLYDTVRDVSLDQTDSSSSTQWKKCDIVASDRAIDIKSARSCFNNQNRYSEFSVTTFKKITTNKDVCISAMFSKYRTAKSIAAGDIPQFLWLGETSKADIEKLFIFVQRSFGHTFETSNFERVVQNGVFLPGWLFNYPEKVYTERKKGLNRLEESKDLVRYSQKHSDSNVKYPISIWSDCISGLSKRDQIIAQTFIEMKKECGLELGAIFLTCLGLCLQSFRDPSLNLTPSELRKYLFLEGRTHRLLQPLGVLDPMGFVDELLSSLEIVFERSRNTLSEFCAFRLAGKGLLQGKSKYGQWKTILAYCGGEVKQFGVKCGNSPLVFGLHSSCETCGKLICNKCGFCNTKCTQCYSSDRGGILSEAPYISAIGQGFDPFTERSLSNPEMFSGNLEDIVF